MEEFKILKEDDIENNFKVVSSVEEKINEILKEKRSWLENSLIDCESPIEQLLALAFEDIGITYSERFNEDLEIIGATSQYEIECDKEKYRVDFLIPVIFYKKIYRSFVIECDGYEFHQKTKEQIEKDNTRQRSIQKDGYIVIRFSGSEIYKDASKCALEVLDIIRETYKRIGKEYGFKKDN